MAVTGLKERVSPDLLVLSPGHLLPLIVTPFCLLLLLHLSLCNCELDLSAEAETQNGAGVGVGDDVLFFPTP